MINFRNYFWVIPVLAILVFALGIVIISSEPENIEFLADEIECPEPLECPVYVECEDSPECPECVECQECQECDLSFEEKYNACFNELIRKSAELNRVRSEVAILKAIADSALKKEYVKHEYDCTEFTWDFIDSMREAGFETSHLMLKSPDSDELHSASCVWVESRTGGFIKPGRYELLGIDCHYLKDKIPCDTWVK